MSDKNETNRRQLSAECEPHTPRTYTWYVQISQSRRVDYQESVKGATKFLSVLWKVNDPSCSVTFHVRVAKGIATMAFAVSSWESARARRLAGAIAQAVTATETWLGLTAPTRRRPWRSIPKESVTLSPAETSQQPVAREALAWTAAAADGGTWHMSVALHARGDDVTTTARMEQVVSPTPGIPVFMTETATETALASVRLHGKRAADSVVAALLTSDNAESTGLRVNPQHPLAEPYPIDILAHLLATPARLHSLMPEYTHISAADYLGMMEDAPTPHGLVVGASGQGKSTGLSRIGQRELARGRTLIVVDVHDGDLVRRLRDEAARQGRPCLFVDFGEPDPRLVPVLRIADPPIGVSDAAHLEDLWTMLRSDVWAEMPQDYFGPTGTRVTRAGLALAIKDPAREFGLGDVARLIDPREDAFRRAVLTRVADKDLTRTVLSEIMPMVSSKDDNSAAWISSKFAPLSTPAVRAILEGRENRVPVEEAIQRGWSILVHAPAASLGEDASRILVAALLHRVWGAMRRMPDADPITLILDEWQKYASHFTSVLLAEARKYGGRLVMANQNFAQLPSRIRETVLSNIGALATYRVGPADAALLDGLFPTIPTRVMQTLPPHTLALSTFESDLVASGPTPLPAAEADGPTWQEALTSFWDGPEPALKIEEAPDLEEAAPSGQRSSFVDDFLARRSASQAHS